MMLDKKRFEKILLSLFMSLFLFASPMLGASGPLPAKYDLRPRLPAVRDQGDFGTCWSFAIIGSLESNLIQKGVVSKDINLSEYYLAYYTFNDESKRLYSFRSAKDTGFDTEATDWKSAAILARGTGPVYEREAPYPKKKSQAARPSVLPRKFKLRSVLYLPDENNCNVPLRGERIRTVKEAILRYGAASAVLYCPDRDEGERMDMEDLLSSSWGYYSGFLSAEEHRKDGRFREPNHDVMIVGWDDGFSRDRFGGAYNPALKPEKDGAWVVRNSWGGKWGDKGYFYVSYEEGTMMNGIFYEAVPAVPDENIYQYDVLGMSYHINGDFVPVADKQRGAEAWCANIFTAVRAERINSVAFYTTEGGTECEVMIYQGCPSGSPVGGTLAASLKLAAEAPGYHTVDLPQSVAVKSGERFSVVVRLKSPRDEFPIAVERKLEGDPAYDKSSAAPGESWISATGKYWTDLYDLDETANVCVKAFATPAAE